MRTECRECGYPNGLNNCPRCNMPKKCPKCGFDTYWKIRPKKEGPACGGCRNFIEYCVCNSFNVEKNPESLHGDE